MNNKRENLITKITKTLGGLGFSLTKKAIEWLASEAEQELAKVPRIAIIGETGVGKSTTLNVLFNAGAPIDHIKPCTEESSEYVVVSEIEGKQGTLRIYDMPGIGKDTKSDLRFLDEYSRILANCEVALWILDASTRTLSQVESSLRNIVYPSMSGFDKIVIALNKVDKIEPDNWNKKTNMPSTQQLQNIEARVKNVKDRFKDTLQWTDPIIVAYSAKRHYRLGELIHAVINACPSNRRWVLCDQVARASFEELIDPAIIEKLKRKNSSPQN